MEKRPINGCSSSKLGIIIKKCSLECEIRMHHCRTQIIQSYLPGGAIVQPYLINGSFGLCKSAAQVASELVQPICTCAQHTKVLCFTMHWAPLKATT